MYINRIENRITFKIKNGYYLELLTPETMKLLGSTESKITQDKNGENVPHLEVVELVLVHCNLVNNDYQQDSRILSIEPRERRYVKGYGFLSFARNVSDKYSKSLMDKGIDVS